jgi:hypothetical protein
MLHQQTGMEPVVYVLIPGSIQISLYFRGSHKYLTKKGFFVLMTGQQQTKTLKLKKSSSYIQDI